MKLTLREADALIAEKVMGWQRLTNNEVNPGLWDGSDPENPCDEDELRFGVKLSPYWYDGDKKQVEVAENCGSYEDAEYAWSPSLDPADSKRLRDKLRGSFAVHVIAYCTIASDQSSCQLWRRGACAFEAIKATEELAVALCALKSIGIDAEIGD